MDVLLINLVMQSNIREQHLLLLDWRRQIFSFVSNSNKVSWKPRLSLRNTPCWHHVLLLDVMGATNDTPALSVPAELVHSGMHWDQFSGHCQGDGGQKGQGGSYHPMINYWLSNPKWTHSASSVSRRNSFSLGRTHCPGSTQNPADGPTVHEHGVQAACCFPLFTNTSQT